MADHRTPPVLGVPELMALLGSKAAEAGDLYRRMVAGEDTGAELRRALHTALYAVGVASKRAANDEHALREAASGELEPPDPADARWARVIAAVHADHAGGDLLMPPPPFDDTAGHAPGPHTTNHHHEDEK